MVLLGLFVLLVIVLLANVGLHEGWARDSVHLLIGALNATSLVFGLLMLVGANLPLPADFGDPALRDALRVVARDLGLVGLATALLGTLLIVRPVRRALVGGLGRLGVGSLDASSPVHTTALVFIVYLLATIAAQWLVADGVGGLADLSGPVPLAEVLASGGMAAGFALLGSGLWVRRSWRETLERLGVSRVEPPSLLTGVLGAGGMLAFLMASSGLWFVLAPDSFDELSSATNILFGEFRSIPVALVVALSTAVGEELLFRGALQPRLGLLPASLLFAVLHVQYTLSPAALIIFGVGLGLGLLRLWRDTTTAIVAHFVYNFTLLAAAAVMPQ